MMELENCKLKKAKLTLKSSLKSSSLKFYTSKSKKVGKDIHKANDSRGYLTK
jgi:hypothetical protein